jgi:hypothetical protein
VEPAVCGAVAAGSIEDAGSPKYNAGQRLKVRRIQMF